MLAHGNVLVPIVVMFDQLMPMSVERLNRPPARVAKSSDPSQYKCSILTSYIGGVQSLHEVPLSFELQIESSDPMKMVDAIPRK